MFIDMMNPTVNVDLNQNWNTYVFEQQALPFLPRSVLPSAFEPRIFVWLFAVSIWRGRKLEMHRSKKIKRECYFLRLRIHIQL